MAFTYSKIATYTVGSGGVPTVSFLNIPQTYTDLVVKISARTIRVADEDGLYMVMNGQNSAGFDNIEGNGGSVSSVTTASYGANWVSRINGNNSTSNIFSNVDIYIFDYTSPYVKPISIDGVMESVTTTSYMNLTASAGSAGNARVTSLLFAANASFLQHTTFHLYGVKVEL